MVLALAPLPFRASKRFTFDGREVAPGDVIDVSTLPAPRVLNLESAHYGQRVVAELLPEQITPPGGAAHASGSVDLPSPDLDAAPAAEAETMELDDGPESGPISGSGEMLDASDLLDVGEEVVVLRSPAPAKKAGRSPGRAKAHPEGK